MFSKIAEFSSAFKDGFSSALDSANKNTPPDCIPENILRGAVADLGFSDKDLKDFVRSHPAVIQDVENKQKSAFEATKARMQAMQSSEKTCT